MHQFFKKPNPYSEDLRSNVKLIFYIALGVLAFLSIFQPIDLSPFTWNEIGYFVGGTSIITFLILIFNIILLPSLFPKLFLHSKKSFVRDLFWNIWILLSLSLGNLLLFVQLFGLESIHFDVVTKISLMGFLPLLAIIITNNIRVLRAQLRMEREKNSKETVKESNPFVHFISEYKNDDFLVQAQSILMIKAADNYIEVYYESENGYKVKMIRSSLLKAEQVLLEYPFLMRVQRSYIVNLDNIKEIQNSSDGYKLLFHFPDLCAFVSQKYIESFKLKIKNNP